jgi:hypothetical protein
MSIQVRATFAEILVAKIYQSQSETIHFGDTLNEDIPCYFRTKVYNVGTQFSITVILIKI